tara:strand:- start:2947 stop:3492 length:546 start_codon:yes stop_codon:yes gene_type:complete
MASILKVDTIKKVDDSVPTVADLGINVTGSVLQVKQAILTTSSSANIEGWYDLTGLSVAITPTSTSSKILVQANVFGAVSNAGWLTAIRILRGSTILSIGTSGSNANNNSTSLAYMAGSTAQGDGKQMTVDILDSPSTTSETTYKVQYYGGNTGVTTYINRISTSANMCTISTITLMEIAG